MGTAKTHKKTGVTLCLKNLFRSLASGRISDGRVESNGESEGGDDG